MRATSLCSSGLSVEGSGAASDPRPLSRITVGVLGLGKLGAAAARALVSVGFDVRGWSRTPKTIPGMRCMAGREALDAFLRVLEIAVVMLPLTGETRGLRGARELARLPQDAKLVNISRGVVVDERALLDALRSGQLREATLDVSTVEPLSAGHPFWAMENVLITLHLASITVPEEAA